MKKGVIMNRMEWSDGIGNRSRSPWLLFIKGDEIIPFNGGSIPGVVVISGTDSEKAGKWSHTTYRLQLADGIRVIVGRDGWETGRFVEGLGAAAGCATPDTWPQVALALGVSVPSAMDFLRSWRPKAAARLDEVEQALADLEDACVTNTTPEDPVSVVISFGGPTNREIRDGFWESPKGIPGYKAEIRLKDRSQGWTEGNIAVAGISGTVLSVKHSAGYHGGYYAVSVAVVPGTETEIKKDSRSDERSPSGMSTLGDALRKAGL